MGRKWTQVQKDRMREIMLAKNAGGSASPSYSGESLRGYSFPIHQRDNFKCRYCGVDGTQSLDTWLTLTSEHLLPTGHPNRNNPDYIVTACSFCNTADNHYFEHAEKRGLKFDELTPDELIAQRLPYVRARREEYKTFWETNVKPFPRERDESDWAGKLFDLFAAVRLGVLEKGMTDEEVNQIIDEALAEVRAEQQRQQTR